VKTGKSLEVIFLTALVILLGYVAHTRGLLPRLRAAPATLDGRFLKEEAWIVDQIVRDITEMSADPAKSAAVSIQLRDGIYDVARASQVRGQEPRADRLCVYCSC
jgi:hypothetical protein